MIRTRIIGLLSLVLAACSAASDGEVVDDSSEEGSGSQSAAATGVSGLVQPGSLKSPAEGFAVYDSKIDGVSRCGGPSLRSGPQMFSDYLKPFGIVANSYKSCQPGFHPIGQALDVFLYGSSAMQAFATWITANNGEMARRLGIVQVIWNHHMWRSYNAGSGRPQGAWGVYNGADPHTTHVHISFGSAGAAGTTSFFTQVVK